MQTDPTFFRSPDRMLEQGIHFDGLAPNIIVKFPATDGRRSRVMEEATYRGVSVNGTVSFSVAQAVAAAEAVERGLRRREAEGLPVDDMGPVITIMMGRLEDWLRVQTERDGIVVDPAALPWSGVAVFKRAYGDLPGARAPRPAARRRDPPPPTTGRSSSAVTSSSPCRPSGSAGSTPRSSRSGRGSTIRSTRPSSTSCGRDFPDFVRASSPTA